MSTIIEMRVVTVIDGVVIHVVIHMPLCTAFRSHYIYRERERPVAVPNGGFVAGPERVLVASSLSVPVMMGTRNAEGCLASMVTTKHLELLDLAPIK